MSKPVDFLTASGEELVTWYYCHPSDSPESHLKPLSYVYPNTEYEWGEAKRYSELKPLGKEEWGELVSDGEVYSWSELVDVSNYDEDLQNLLPTKLNNVKTLIQAGEIQLPIVGRWPSGEYELISGNTRIAVLTKLGYDPYVIVIECPPQETDNGKL
jgi:hypothetical protein